MEDEQAKRRLIAAALLCTNSPLLMPNPYEQLVAQQYIAGSLSIQQAVALLEAHHRYLIAAPPRGPGCTPVAGQALGRP